MGSQFRRDRRRASADRADFLASLKGSTTHRAHKADHKTPMLCRQVERALSLWIGECGDDAVGQLTVVAALPAPNASHLVVQLGVPKQLDVTMQELLERIDRITPAARYAIGQSISRKRVPSVTLVPVALTSEGGDHAC